MEIEPALPNPPSSLSRRLSVVAARRHGVGPEQLPLIGVDPDIFDAFYREHIDGVEGPRRRPRAGRGPDRGDLPGGDRFGASVPARHRRRPISRGTASTSATVARPTGLAAPREKEIAMELVSSAENSRLDWRGAFGYIEDIGDGRGYTVGLIGFCSGPSTCWRARPRGDRPEGQALPLVSRLRKADLGRGRWIERGCTPAALRLRTPI
jgi:hypothetical protein